MKKKWNKKEIEKILLSRLRTQRRIFEFDNNQILVLPHLEHGDLDIKIAIKKIKFFIDSGDTSVNLDQIEKLEVHENGAIILQLNSKEAKPLYYKKMNGEFEQMNIPKFEFKNITIDHSPSIHVVLFTKYLNSCNDFDALAKFTSSINPKLNLKDIKCKGFKELVDKVLCSKLPNEIDVIKKAYSNLFETIELEMNIAENNNANLSLSSLNYFKKECNTI